MKKINIAVLRAQKLFPKPGVYDKSEKPAELIVILKFISEQIHSLGTYLCISRSAGIPVNFKLGFFHRTIDRLLLLGSLICKDFHLLSGPRDHYESFKDDPASRFFGLLDTNHSFWSEGIDINVVLRDYVKTGTEAGKSLVALDGMLTGYIHAKAASTGNDALGRWFAKEFERALFKKSSSIDPENELAVFAMAFKGYSWMMIEKKGEVSVQKFVRTLRGLLANDNCLSMEVVERSMYQVIGNYFVRAVAKSDEERKKLETNRKLEMINFKVIIESEVSRTRDPVREQGSSKFANIVRLARRKLPFAKPHKIFALAEKMYYSPYRDFYVQQALSTKRMLVQRVNSGGAKQNPVRHGKLKGGKPVDLLRRVQKTGGTKRKDDKVRFAQLPSK